MRVIAKTGREDLAYVYIVEFGEDRLVECVESLQPPHPRESKWILLLSTMFGCPVRCKMCDAGGFYKGKLSKVELFEQIDFMIRNRYPDGHIPVKQLKIQFARMGEPALNPAVLDLLDELPQIYDAPGLMPSISTVAPGGCGPFLERLREIKNRHYANGHFQFQFSVHTTDLALRDEIIPIKKWGFAEMAKYGDRFYRPGDRKITLNFALAKGSPLEAETLLNYFDPARYLIKITPLNPTYKAAENGLVTQIDPMSDGRHRTVEHLKMAGYDVLLSIGEVDENAIGSNCGQYIQKHLQAENRLMDGYLYEVQDLVELLPTL